MIIVKSSSIHGKGVFAKTEIKNNTLIGTFEGALTDTDDTYVLWLQDDNDNWYGIKGKNDLRFLNHSDKPNAEFDSKGELHSIKEISQGEEITIHYGDDWNNE